MSDQKSKAQLDPEPFAHEPDVHRVVAALSKAIEAAREKQIKTWRPPRNLLDDGPGWIQQEPWYEFAKEPGLMFLVSSRLGIKVHELTQLIDARLSPPNRDVFFWMSLYMAQAHNRPADLKATVKKEMSERNTRAAHVMHKADTEAKAVGLALYAEKKWKTKDAAADEICLKVNRSYETVRRWLRGLP